MIQIKKIGVIGAGSMGQGIAQVCAGAGYDVLFSDINVAIVERGLQRISLNLDQAIAKGKATATKKAEILKRIKPANFDALKVEFVIEAAVEKMDIKQRIFTELEKQNSPDTILATNTSSLLISSIASHLDHQSRFLGLHFFNPAHVMKLVEVVAGKNTAQGIVAQMKSFVESLQKIPVVVKDSPGFIVNRVARHYYLESLKALEEGAAEVSGIDELMRSSGFKLGPFELMDLIGNDVNLEVSKQMYEAFEHTPRFKPSPIQVDKVSKGELGKKTGKGYYHYENT